MTKTTMMTKIQMGDILKIKCNCNICDDMCGKIGVIDRIRDDSKEVEAYPPGYPDWLKRRNDEYRKSLPVKYFLRFINRNRCTGLWLIESQLEPVDVHEYMKEVAIATKEAQKTSEEALTAAQIAATIGIPVEDVETVLSLERV